MVGILTERDILVRVVAPGRAAYRVTVAEVMTRALVTIDPTASVDDAMRLMTETRHRHLPVTNNGTISGLVLVLYITHG